MRSVRISWDVAVKCSGTTLTERNEHHLHNLEKISIYIDQASTPVLKY